MVLGALTPLDRVSYHDRFVVEGRLFSSCCCVGDCACTHGSGIAHLFLNFESSLRDMITLLCPALDLLKGLFHLTLSCSRVIISALLACTHFLQSCMTMSYNQQVMGVTGSDIFMEQCNVRLTLQASPFLSPLIVATKRGLRSRAMFTDNGLDPAATMGRE